jgi:hypothetical protein
MAVIVDRGIADHVVSWRRDWVNLSKSGTERDMLRKKHHAFMA